MMCQLKALAGLRTSIYFRSRRLWIQAEKEPVASKDWVKENEQRRIAEEGTELKPVTEGRQVAY